MNLVLTRVGKYFPAILFSASRSRSGSRPLPWRRIFSFTAAAEGAAAPAREHRIQPMAAMHPRDGAAKAVWDRMTPAATEEAEAEAEAGPA